MIQVEYRDTIAILRLQHGKVNAMDLELLSDFAEKLERIQQSAASAIVITGTGTCFCAGVDLFRIVEGGESYVQDFLPRLTDLLLSLFTFPRPVIAAANGHAIAGGCVLVFACDYKIMAKGEGKIGTPELLVGVPFPSLPLEIVRFSTPAHYFQDLVYGGRNYSPSEALQIGIIDTTVEPDHLIDRACSAAERLAAIHSESFHLTKRIMRQPAIDRFQKYRNTVDREAMNIWSSANVQQTIREYLQRTIGRNGR